MSLYFVSEIDGEGLDGSDSIRSSKTLCVHILEGGRGNPEW